MQFLHQSYSIERDIWAYSSNYQVLRAFELISSNIRLFRYVSNKELPVNYYLKLETFVVRFTPKSYKYFISCFKFTSKCGNYVIALIARYDRDALKLYCTRCSVSSIL